jgi:hypothetical protein
MTDESNFDNPVSANQFDKCAKCKKQLGVNYVTGNRKARYKDQDGKIKRRRAAIKNMYCDEKCCEGHGAEVSDTFAFH